MIIQRSNQLAAEKKDEREQNRARMARMRFAWAQQGGDAAHSKNGGSSEKELPNLDYAPITDRGRDPGPSTSTEGIGIRQTPPQTGAETVQNSR